MMGPPGETPDDNHIKEVCLALIRDELKKLTFPMPRSGPSVCEVFQVAQVHLDKLVLQVHKVLKVDVVNQVHPVTMVQLVLLVLRVLKANEVNEVHKVCPFAENLV